MFRFATTQAMAANVEVEGCHPVAQNSNQNGLKKKGTQAGSTIACIPLRSLNPAYRP